jgi:DNA-binding ferritin-like protein
VIDESVLNELKKRIDDHEKRIAALEGSPVKKPQSEMKKLSIKEFLLDKKPENDVQKTLAIGYYLEHLEGLNGFNIKDLAEGFRSAKEPAPTNINDKVNSNIQKGYMMEEKEKRDKLSTWVLTNSGEKFIEGEQINEG